MSLAQVAAQLWPTSDHTKVSRIETAEVKVSDVDLLRMLTFYGVTDPEEQGSLLALAAAARQRNWYHKYSHVLSGPLYAYIALEQDATELRTWSLGTINGLLQAASYARATYGGVSADRPGDWVDRQVDARLRRQQRLYGNEVKLWAVLDESILHRPIGGVEVLREQLDHLLNQPPSVTIQVLPYGEVWHQGLYGAFTHMEFAQLPAVAFVETVSGDQHLEREEEVQEYREAFNRLTRMAHAPIESASLIKSIRDSL